MAFSKTLRDDLIEDLRQWAEQAARTYNPDAPQLYYRIGLLGEIGELLNLYKKDRWHTKPCGPEAYADEIGDCMWYALTLLRIEGEAAFESGCRIAVTRFDTLLDFESFDEVVEQFAEAVYRGIMRYDHTEAYGLIIGYLLAIAERAEISVQLMLEANERKLRARYPYGFVTFEKRADIFLED